MSDQPHSDQLQRIPAMRPTREELSRVRVCSERCASCIFSAASPITAERRREYQAIWQRGDTFQNCHHGTVTDDHALMCRGFYDWCLATDWQPTILQLAERLGRLDFVAVPQ